jgi:hypothetical protein
LRYSGSMAEIGTVLSKSSKRIRAKANLSKKGPTAREIVALLELIMWWPVSLTILVRRGRNGCPSGGRPRGRQGHMRSACLAVGLVFVVSTAAAQHRHPPQDEALHETCYSTWYMPDNPARSCCNKADCYPTEIKYVGGNVYARRREDGNYILIPPWKIERNRDNPDGRNHLCAPPPGGSYDTVFCFSLGGGI